MEDNITPGWRTSSYTGNGGGNCVEVGDAMRVILVRDTKDRTGPALRFSSDVWRRFAELMKRSLASDLDLGPANACRRHPRSARRHLHADGTGFVLNVVLRRKRAMRRGVLAGGPSPSRLKSS